MGRLRQAGAEVTRKEGSRGLEGVRETLEAHTVSISELPLSWCPAIFLGHIVFVSGDTKASRVSGAPLCCPSKSYLTCLS